MFLSPWFAVAGLIAAAGPIAIHLLNRQRFRVVEWAAMEFLRHAVRRSRRIMRLEDLFLMAVRVLCVLLFGLAMARPYFVRSGDALPPDQPVHAVLLVDNSLSMGYEQLGRSLLDEAKARAGELIDRLPTGSRVSIVPICVGAQDFSFGAYGTREDAMEALAAIRPIDGRATAVHALDLAYEACRRTPSPPNKQIILLSDQQAANWPTQSLGPQLAQLAGPLQIVQVAPKDAENAWIADFRLVDGMADLQSPAVFVATIRFEGTAPRRDVPVTLCVDGAVFAAAKVDLEPGQAREVRFPPYRFDLPVRAGQVTFVPAEVSIPRDGLAADDRRVLVVPVVSALPVVMVDQWGADEDPQRNRFGETRRLRQLLAPVLSRQDRDPQLIRMRHVKFTQLERELLKDARLVVIAGVRSPEPTAAVGLLREYVEQGGSVVLAAGGEFSPADWSEAAWQGGRGILPAPLKPEPVGALPTSAAKRVEPFQLDVGSLAHDYFILEQTPREELEELYRRPFFFKAVRVDLNPAVLEQTVQPAFNPEQPRWLLWSDSLETRSEDAGAPEEAADRTRPRVLASFTNGVPFLVERQIGRGRVLFVSTGVFREWNTLTSTDAVVIFDRMLRDLLQRTLPRRNFASTEPIVLPVAPELRGARFALADPAGREKSVSIEALSGQQYGIRLGGLVERGVYRLVARSGDPAPQPSAEAKLLDVPLAVNGPAEESELRYLDESALRERIPEAPYRWVGPGESIRLTPGSLAGQDLWKWLVAAVLAALFGESAILAWPLVRRGRNP